MQQAVIPNLNPVIASLASGGTRSPFVLRRGPARVRSMRNGSTDSLDHLQRASKIGQQPSTAPRRRIVRTTPFGLWDSFPEARTLDQMVRTMERIMEAEEDDANGRAVVVPPAPRGAAIDNGAATAGYRGRAPWEVRERAGEYLVRFDMPGMTRDDVRVSVQGQTLMVLAEKAAAAAKAVGKEQVTTEETVENEEEAAWPPASFGRYRTRVELPENVEVERIAAEVRDGVLYIAIPKVSSGAKVVNIQVQ